MLFLRNDALSQTAAASTPKPLSDREQAAARGNLCSQANAIGVGLRGDYFAGENFAGSVLLTRVDPIIDFDRSLDWPANRERAVPRSVRWSGWLKPPLGGEYRFHCDAPGARVVVSRVVQVGEGALPNAAAQFDAGRFYPIIVEAPRLSGLKDRLRLEWTAPHGARYVIPRQLLHLPSDTVSSQTRT